MKSRTISAGFATRRRPNEITACAGHQAAVRRECDAVYHPSCDFSCNSNRSPARSHSAISPRDSPESNFVPSGEYATDSTQPPDSPARELFDRPAGLHVKDHDPRARGVRIRGGEEPTSGENATAKTFALIRR